MTDLEEKIEAVRLKGTREGLWVTLDPNRPLNELKPELHRLFTQMKRLAENARVIIDSGTPAQDENLIKELAHYLTEHFKVLSVSAPPRDPPASPSKQRPPDVSTWFYRRSDALIICGRVRSGQKLNSRNHLVLLGDINPGGEVTAGGDILVLGRLGGMAIAGQRFGEESIILSLDFRPTQIQIADVVAAGLPPGNQKTVEYAYIEEGKIVVSPYLDSDPFGKLPWLALR